MVIIFEWLLMEQWSPYIAGVGIGILCWFAFLLSNKPIGCSTAFTRTSGMIERIIRGSKVNEKPYYKNFTPSIDWEVMLVFGIVIGAFVSSMISGVFQLRWVPLTWTESFGDNFTLSFIKENSAPAVVQLFSKNLRFAVDEKQTKALVASSENNWSWKLLHFKYQHNSELTTTIIHDI